jgi:predicted nucleic acid-binding Zn ribbon protein
MPTYEYYCPANHKTVEVMHGMSRTVATWAELCELADQPTGQTAGDTPVEKLLSAGMVISSHKDAPPIDCGMPGGCCGGGCSMG